MTFSERFYRALLRLYPAGYRRDYSAPMAQMFRDLYRDERRRHLLCGAALLWLRVLPDLVVSVVIEHRESRKANLMASARRADMVSVLVFLLPSLAALLLLFDPKVLNGESLRYAVAALVGAAGYLLGRIGLIPRLRFWGGYTAGLLMFVFAFFAINIWSPSMNVGIEALKSSPLVTLRSTVHIVVCLATIAGLYLTARRSTAPFRIALVALALNLVMWTILHNTPRDAPVVSSATWMLGYTALALFVAAGGIRLTSGAGIQSLVAVTAGLGMQLMLFTVDEYRGQQLILMILLGAFVPLIVCPAWLFLTRTWRVQKYGLLVIWTLMLLGMSLVDLLNGRSPGVPRLDSVFVLYRIGIYLPIWVGLWLALNMAEREAPASPASDRPLIASRAPL